MDKNTQKALAAIKNISSARSLRDFRKKIYAKTDLSYGEAILAQHELIADKELIKKTVTVKDTELQDLMAVIIHSKTFYYQSQMKVSVLTRLEKFC